MFLNFEIGFVHHINTCNALQSRRLTRTHTPTTVQGNQPSITLPMAHWGCQLRIAIVIATPINRWQQKWVGCVCVSVASPWHHRMWCLWLLAWRLLGWTPLERVWWCWQVVRVIGCHVGPFRSVYSRIMWRWQGVFLTVFEDTNEQGFVSLTVPPVSWDLSMERLGDPDIQLTDDKDRYIKSVLIELSRFSVFNLLQFVLYFNSERGKRQNGEKND